MFANTKFVSRKGLFVGVCAVALAFIGCISIPLGDPEKAKVDDKLTGAWITAPEENGEQTLFTVVPYDARTCLLTQFGFKKNGDAIEGGGRFDWKMWVVDVQGTKFVSLEMKNPQLVFGQEKDRFSCAKIALNGDTITMQRVKDDFVTSANITTPQQFEELIAKNLNNAAMFEEAMTLTKVKEEQKEEIGKVFEAFNGKK